MKQTKRLTEMAVLAAMSIILVATIHFPIFPAAPFLEYDPADIPIFIGTFMFGPIAGLVITVVVSVIQGLTVSAQSGVIGIAMHIFATGSFVLVAGQIYKRNRTKKGAVTALIAGVFTMVLAMTVWNYIVTPIFMGVPREAVAQMLIPVIIPFNLIKAGFNAIITFILYKPLSGFLERRIEGNEEI